MYFILSIISLKINLKHKEIKKCFIDILTKVKEIKNVIDIFDFFVYNVELRSQRSQINQNERKEGCGLKYRVVSILKDNRPRFLIISDIEEIEILPSKYLKHLDQINASPNTVKSAAFALSYYYNYLQEQTIGLDEITLLSYSEQNKTFY